VAKFGLSLKSFITFFEVADLLLLYDRANCTPSWRQAMNITVGENYHSHFYCSLSDVQHFRYNYF
jgi:hypothetical protein